ncbi:MAG: SDR family NAD(P)-dependent oxidoreductase [Sphingomonas sp.]|nr:SDR family NAD(P)-dependent oxidoreductase [Sphingomonas sp.]
MELRENVILITGGGSGIGRALAHRLHDLGNQVIITGRRLEALEETRGDREEISVYPLDMNDPAAIEHFAVMLADRHPNLNVLVNNAGIMAHEDISLRRDLGDTERMITTNLLGPIRLINALVEQLAARPGSAIVNITSGLAFVPLPRAATYSATKAALHSYTRSLRRELHGKVNVIEIAPPAVRTELTPGQADREAYMPLDEFADEVIELWKARPTAGEIMVERVHPLRFADRDGRAGEMEQLLSSL